jgi:thioredoxin 1
MAVDGIDVALTDRNFETVVLESPQPVLVSFAAEGYGPLHLLAPEIAAIQKAFRDRVTVATLDVEAQPRTPERYGVGTLPAVLSLQDGRVVDQLSGVVDRADMEVKLHALTRNSRSSRGVT